jgi:phage-related protein
MLYLDSLLYIIIIILLCILVNKIVNKKEGFEHKGKSQVYTKKNTTSVIKSAVYGSFINGPKDCIDVKPILDKLISTATESMVVSQNTLDKENRTGDDKEQKYLIINFTTTAITLSDAIMRMPREGLTNGFEIYADGWLFIEGGSVSLKFGNGDPTPAWLRMSAAMYKIAELFAYIIIRMPYKFITQLVDAGIAFVENFKDILAPIISFYNQMMAIARSVIKQLYKVFKGLFDQYIAIIKDIPGFLKAQFKNMINFIQDAVTKTFSFLQKIFDIAMTIFNALIQIPMTLFDILDQLTDVFVNVFLILLNIPTSALNMVIGMQKIMLDIMNKTPTIPFMNLFFQ